MATKNRISKALLPACLVAAVAAVTAAAIFFVQAQPANVHRHPTSNPEHPTTSPPQPPTTGTATRPAGVRTWTISYRAYDGALRGATVVLPSWYGPHRNPTIPLVISPHGRGGNGHGNAHLWGTLPGAGGFAVVNPDGEGRRLGRFSWGARGQIDDLARMPRIVQAALPWLRVDLERVYALGGSMGGQETLLLVALHPRLLAGAVAVDSLVDFARQYRNFPRLSCGAGCRRAWGGPLGVRLQWLARREVGGSPTTARAAYAARSPMTYARAIAFSCVPLHIWWSRTDRIVVDSSLQSGRLFARIAQLNASAPVAEYTGSWAHTAIMRAGSRLPMMLAQLGLLPTRHGPRPDVSATPACGSAS
jgi:dipeptidyl aminopeptidase/acylaminoacyl peptidase